jgi:hypothetical protein
MTDAEIKKGGHYRTRHFGILRIVGHFFEGGKHDRRKVYDGAKPGDSCNYNVMACELTGCASESEWRSQ